MRLQDLPPRDVRPLLVAERRELLALLRSLTASEWTAVTAVPGWRVKDIALHVLDDDLGWLSRGRDGDLSSLLDESVDHRDFVASLDRKNQSWVDAAHGLSARVVCDLLEWSGHQTDRFFSAKDLRAPAGVIWAAADDVPAWLDLGRDLTERWVHHHQIVDALARSTRSLEPYLDVVLRTFVWAFPHQFTVAAAPGTQVVIDLGDDRVWTLTCTDGWTLDEGAAAADATVSMPGDTAWRLLTGAPYDTSTVVGTGRDDLVQAALAVRGIIV